MVALGFLNESNAPTPDATKNFPTDVEALTPQQAEKNIVFFHDESTFQANDMTPGSGEREDNMY